MGKPRAKARDREHKGTENIQYCQSLECDEGSDGGREQGQTGRVEGKMWSWRTRGQIMKGLRRPAKRV